MAVKLKIKKGDSVKIIAGDDKGKIAKVVAVFPKSSQVIVEGCKSIWYLNLKTFMKIRK